MHSLRALVVGLVSGMISSICATKHYTLDDADHYQGDSFFDKFNFADNPDLNHGFVRYLSYAEAASGNLGGKLVEAKNDGTAYMGVDVWNNYTVNPFGGSSGRPSVRIESKAAYTHGLFIADITHMPGSICGLWPAFWTVNKETWPQQGEIDIIENIHENTASLSTFHTGNSPSIACSVAGNKKGQSQTGSQTSYNCNQEALSSAFGSQWTGQACSANNTNPNSYGTGFNAAGGGVYAMEWTSTSIKVWNWGRHDIPSDILSGQPEPTSWGLPITFTDTTTCAIDTAFAKHQIIFNTNFCGDWANQTSFWQQTSCYKNDKSKYASCEHYVAENPQAFTEAYWSIKSVKVYQEREVVDSITLSVSKVTTSATKTSSASSLPFTSSISTFVTSSTVASTVSSTNTLSSTELGPLTSTMTVLSTSTMVTITSTSSIPIASAWTESDLDAPIDTHFVTTAASTRPATVTDVQNLTTSTIYATVINTITSCAPSVTDCDVGAVITKTIALSTTVCTISPSLPSSSSHLSTTSTVYATITNTITFCAVTVTNCNVGALATFTVIFSTTVCEVKPVLVGPSLTTTTILTTYTSAISYCHPTATNCLIGSIATETPTITSALPVKLVLEAEPTTLVSNAMHSASISTSTSAHTSITKTVVVSLVQASQTASTAKTVASLLGTNMTSSTSRPSAASASVSFQSPIVVKGGVGKCIGGLNLITLMAGLMFVLFSLI